MRITDEVIQKLYIEFDTPEHVKRHCQGVTDCALRIAKALNEHGYSLDLEMIYGAGMTHDMARVQDEHWNVAADKLEELGYFDEAKIVRVHMQPSTYSPIELVHEGDMINLGDRLVKEDTYVGIDERFEYIIDKARRFDGEHFEQAKERILGNKAKMQKLLDEIERVIGCSIDDLYK